MNYRTPARWDTWRMTNRGCRPFSAHDAVDHAIYTVAIILIITRFL